MHWDIRQKTHTILLLKQRPLSAKKLKSMYLIAGVYHIPRAMQKMSYRLPNINIISYPIQPKSIKTTQWYLFPSTLGIFVKGYTKNLLTSIRNSLEKQS